MYRRIKDFVDDYGEERDATLRVLAAVTDEALKQQKVPEDISLSDLVWHICFAPYIFLNPFGLGIQDRNRPNPLTAESLRQQYAELSGLTLQRAGEIWADADLAEVRGAFGWEMPLGKWLLLVVKHEAHHRGQLGVMMRQAGLAVPGVYGPNKEETELYRASAQASTQTV